MHWSNKTDAWCVCVWGGQGCDKPRQVANINYHVKYEKRNEGKVRPFIRLALADESEII